MADDDTQTKVKDLVAAFARAAARSAAPAAPAESEDEPIDDATRADLERWFGMPSFQQVAEQRQAAPDDGLDPEMRAIREQREKALAAIDPAIVEAHRRRIEPDRELTTFRDTIALRVDPDMTCVDQARLERVATIAEPREVEIPPQLEDDLKECSPQAILRDLHRPEEDFQKVFEIVDHGTPLDLGGLAASSVMSARYGLVTSERVTAMIREDMRDARETRAQPWVNVLKLRLANRRIDEDAPRSEP